MGDRLRTTTAGSREPRFSWWLLIVPAIGTGVMVFFAYLYLVVVAEERRILDTGRDATAEVARVWSEDSRDSKGRLKINHYVTLSWRDASGAPRNFERLRIGKDAHGELLGNQKAGVTRTAIRYDDASPGSTPFLLADRDYREYDWQFGRWGFLGSVLFTIWAFWLVWNSWRKHRVAT
ncbi:MAG: hypothetical protein ACK4MF_08690 [Hyphomicrobiaceae bacterium]